MGEVETPEAPSQELVRRDQEQGLMLLEATTPAQFVTKATEMATALAQVIRDQRLFKRIGRRDHVFVEGWTFLGSMMGAFGQSVYAVEEWTREYRDPETGEVIGWEARVEAKTGDGRVVGAAESMCTRREEKWADRDDFALRSMAQTRATSKALRQPLGFIIQLAGFAATPQEEMDEEQAREEAKGLRLIEGAPKGWKQIHETLNAADAGREWKPWIEEACELVYGKPAFRDLPDEQAKEFGVRLANASAYLVAINDGGMPPVSDDDVRTCFARAFDGHVLAGPADEVVEDAETVEATDEEEQEEEAESAEDTDAALTPEQSAEMRAEVAENDDVEFAEEAEDKED